MRLETEYATEVGEAENKGIVIRQEDPMSDDALVLLSPARARLVAAELVRLADEIEGRPAHA